MIHDSHIILVTEPTNINRHLNDGVAEWITTFSAILDLLLGQKGQRLACTKVTGTVTNRIDKDLISQ
jgi:hypothetical protein